MRAIVTDTARVKEMIEAHFEQIGRARVARDVAAEFAVRAVGAHHHRERVPSHQRREPLFDREVSGKCRLRVDRDGVDVWRCEFGLPADAMRVREAHQLVEDPARALGTFGRD